MDDQKLSTHRKALRINLDAKVYGTFAEIGAGQEVARWFFRVGGAAGTVAKTISAYDMAVSNAIYGHSDRYVSRQRLEAMLGYELGLLRERLEAARGERNALFVFANTVATRSYSRRKDGDGWMGVRFQTAPRTEPSEIIIHVGTRDRERMREQHALGVVGVNLLYAAVYHHDDPTVLIASLMDGLSPERIEVDLIKFSGPAFTGVDNRLMCLQLVEQGLTDATMFTAAGEVVQPSEVLYKKPVLVERGRFRPITNLTLDILEGARDLFLRDPAVQGEQPIIVMEMTLSDLAAESGVDHRDFLARADILGALGQNVLISNYGRYFQLAEYLSRSTDKRIGIALGIPSIKDIAQSTYYTDLEGGVLESFGRLFKHNVRLYVHPYRDSASGELITVETVRVEPRFQRLYEYLLENRLVHPIHSYNPDYLRIDGDDVLRRLAAGDTSWESEVPPGVAETIKREGLFGWRPSQAA